MNNDELTKLSFCLGEKALLLTISYNSYEMSNDGPTIVLLDTDRDWTTGIQWTNAQQTTTIGADFTVLTFNGVWDMRQITFLGNVEKSQLVTPLVPLNQLVITIPFDCIGNPICSAFMVSTLDDPIFMTTVVDTMPNDAVLTDCVTDPPPTTPSPTATDSGDSTTPPPGTPGGGGGGGRRRECFSAVNTVDVLNKVLVLMGDLYVGDRVRVSSTSGKVRYEEVYSFAHYDDIREKEFLQIHLNRRGHALEVSKEHLLYTSDNSGIPKAIRADQVQVGSTLFVVNGMRMSPTNVTKVTKVTRKGLLLL